VHQLAAFHNELLVDIGLHLVFGLENCLFSGHTTRYKIPAFLVVSVHSYSPTKPAVNARSCSLRQSSSAKASSTSSGVFCNSKTA
jgi:hypothetical protein